MLHARAGTNASVRTVLEICSAASGQCFTMECSDIVTEFLLFRYVNSDWVLVHAIEGTEGLKLHHISYDVMCQYQVNSRT